MNSDIFVGNFYQGNFLVSLLRADAYSRSGCTDANIFDGRVFDWQYYVAIYPDLQGAGIDTFEKAATHWYLYGLPGGRRAAPGFSTVEYLQTYADFSKRLDRGALLASKHSTFISNSASMKDAVAIGFESGQEFLFKPQRALPRIGQRTAFLIV